ncbi:MAG TPA: hypothetical protein VNS32_26055, partial [Flavisolibacter sp.]|nr:hypothetical protein [Flavisolibacter sp.]
ELHLKNKGAKLLAAVNNKGIRWQVVRVWLSGDRALERRLKNYKKSRCFCPMCVRRESMHHSLKYLFTIKSKNLC